MANEVKEFFSNKTSPEAPLPVLILKKKRYFLGGAGNVANNIKKQSQNVFLFSSIVKDTIEKIIKNFLNKNKLKTE